jgi:hypothetical protein
LRASAIHAQKVALKTFDLCGIDRICVSKNVFLGIMALVMVASQLAVSNDLGALFLGNF